MSKRDAGKIIREIDPKKPKLSPHTRALILFANGKSLLEVIFALDMDFKEARTVENQYLAVQNRDKLVELFDEYENQDHIDGIMKLSNAVKKKNVGIHELEDMIDCIRNISELRNQYVSLNLECSRQKRKNDGLNSEIMWLNTIKDKLSMNLFQTKSQIFNLQGDLNKLRTTEWELRSKIIAQMNLVQLGENKINQLIQKCFSEIFDKHEPLLGIMFLSIIEFLRTSQDRGLLKYMLERHDAKILSLEQLWSNGNLAEMMKKIHNLFRIGSSQIVQNYVTNYQPEILPTDKKDIKHSS
jgi:hypothetical protein